MPKVFIISISLFCTLIFGNFVLSPHYQDFKMLRAEIKEKQAELSSKKEYFARIESLFEELKQYPDGLEKIEFALPADPNFAPFFEFLQKSCSENGLILKKINSFATLIPEKGQEIKQNRVDFEVSGDFNSLLNFLATLEKSARIIDIVKISFSTPIENLKVFSFKIIARIHSY